MRPGMAVEGAPGVAEKVLSNAVVTPSGQRNAIILAAAAAVSVAALELEYESLTATRCNPKAALLGSACPPCPRST